MLDPFLLLDEFRSDDPNDYLAGFPDHPHRGFETVTYMLAGACSTRTAWAITGLLGPGNVQWMTAGRGIVHSEMPEQEGGLMWGFQLWVNLPRARQDDRAALSGHPRRRHSRGQLGAGRACARDRRRRRRCRRARHERRDGARVSRSALGRRCELRRRSCPKATTRSSTCSQGEAKVGAAATHDRARRASVTCARCESARDRGRARRAAHRRGRPAAQRAGRALRAVRDEHGSERSSRPSTTIAPASCETKRGQAPISTTVFGTARLAGNRSLTPTS